jgi:DNA-binding HxlR family transcriptional regulator
MEDVVEQRLKAAEIIFHRTRLRLLVYLMANGKTAFSKLADVFKLNPNTLNHHLRQLESAGFVINTWERGSYHSYYNLESRGRKLLGALGVTRQVIQEYKNETPSQR